MLKNCQALAHSLTIYTGTGLNDALATAISDAEDLFQGRVFSGFVKEREAHAKLQVAIIGRLDALAKSLRRR